MPCCSFSRSSAAKAGVYRKDGAAAAPSAPPPARGATAVTAAAGAPSTSPRTTSWREQVSSSAPSRALLLSRSRRVWRR
ncbi:hypothetical protein STCU_10799 [Strigomonas culicis]|uniref:Uncharacterized protein n=1 Tax=Strigomonas culicis TaxID=28005 RepID=S9TGI9_9TRYP|nr:hypothetical protein STCU_10799 [Strigomonas culicis]|eukprot:EPY17132.1 hypothetical protein STCU_10799 [Strigomonas culicis]